MLDTVASEEDSCCLGVAVADSDWDSLLDASVDAFDDPFTIGGFSVSAIFAGALEVAAASFVNGIGFVVPRLVPASSGGATAVVPPVLSAAAAAVSLEFPAFARVAKMAEALGLMKSSSPLVFDLDRCGSTQPTDFGRFTFNDGSHSFVISVTAVGSGCSLDIGGIGDSFFDATVVTASSVWGGFPVEEKGGTCSVTPAADSGEVDAGIETGGVLDPSELSELMNEGAVAIPTIDWLAGTCSASASTCEAAVGSDSASSKVVPSSGAGDEDSGGDALVSDNAVAIVADEASTAAVDAAV